MVITPVNGLIYGISKEDDIKDIECVLYKDMFDHKFSFPGAKWRKSSVIEAKQTPEDKAQVVNLAKLRFESSRYLTPKSSMKEIFDWVFGVIETDGTDYPANKAWKYAVFTSAKLFKASMNSPLYRKSFPVVAIIWHKERRKMYQQSGTLQFSEKGARFKFEPFNTTMSWCQFTYLVRVGEIVAIA